MIDRAEFETLLRWQDRPAITITMPCSLPGPAIRQDPIRLRNLIDEAEARLISQGCDKNDIAITLEPARRLLDDAPQWVQRHRGLALFLAPTFSKIVKLDAPVREMVSCGKYFRLAELLGQLAGSAIAFFVLAISADRAALFDAWRDGMQVDQHPLPQGVDVVAERTRYEQTMHTNPGATAGTGGGSIPQSQALGPSPEDLRKSQLLQFLDEVAAAVKVATGASSAPIVLVAQPEIAGNFRKRADLPGLWSELVAINPWSVDEDQLHQLAWAAIEPHFDQETKEAIDRFNSVNGLGHTTTETSELVKASRWGRMDTLIVGDGQHLWGRFDEAADRVETRAEAEPGDDDLLDVAAQQTLLNGGTVKVVSPEMLPQGVGAAGILRF